MTTQFTYPFTAVGGLIIAKDGDILLVCSHKWGMRYTVPGGKVHYGETLIQALYREIAEETALIVENPRFVQVQESIDSDEFWKKGHFVMHDYLMDLSPKMGKEDVVLNDEGQSCVWTSPKEAWNFPLNFSAKALISAYQRQKVST